ncbi:MAG: outer membrane lipoprotein carrier protein LolA [Bacteroidales bacterium]|nr:outer membrane lipoprotein carrier protein LolA [Bacteroidales bacterium]
MKKKAIFILLLALLFTSVWAQNEKPLTEAESQKVISALTQAASSMQTLQCRFVQEKTSSMLAEPSIAKGTMHYAAPDRMHWEYTEPYAFALVVNGEQITKVTDGKAETLDGKSSRMYQGMVSLIMGSASGKKLFDASVFDVTLYDDNEFWRAEMTPKRRDMKRMFSQLVFRFDKKTNGISRVEFKDAGGDVTSIRFEDMKLNEVIDDNVFKP